MSDLRRDYRVVSRRTASWEAEMCPATYSRHIVCRWQLSDDWQNLYRPAATAIASTMLQVVSDNPDHMLHSSSGRLTKKAITLDNKEKQKKTLVGKKKEKRCRGLLTPVRRTVEKSEKECPTVMALCAESRED